MKNPWKIFVCLLLTGALPSPGAAFERADPAAADDATVDVRCAGGDDDSAAINAAIETIRQRPVSSRYAWPVGHLGKLRLVSRRCVIRNTLNLTHLYGSGFVGEFWGSEILCRTGAKPCIDATGSGQFALLGLNLSGDCETDTPAIGLVLARKTESLSAGADHVHLDHPTLAGCFGLTAFYNRSSETTQIVAGGFYNYRDRAHAAVWDGTNAFGFQSAFYAERYTEGKFSSFNENTCDTCIFETFGSGATPLWIGGAVRHKFINGYALAQHAEGAPALILSFANSAPNDFLDLDIHFENTSLGALISIVGAEHPVIRSLRINEPIAFASGAIFRRDEAVKTVRIEDANIRVGHFNAVGATLFDDASAFAVSGSIYCHEAQCRTPETFSGALCIGGACSWK
ncbi:hypothetical protein GJ654_13405 [Rhodoblastus acidophilus]|uniref:Uncharacterized protein n=1 Tax=Rhodoblastus acidophilus TaxID=1074 RepID=A0A6N8DS23_RHOAC|nr:hypothetical protein [Rhodoblastus acidophilus]MCW2275460.1 hypothetical protein [Rhodoblastus acidophilus]MTV31983.1 hypothetical protein [Rhodoblastus acidophilus]